jgi:hypothetical protein
MSKKAEETSICDLCLLETCLRLGFACFGNLFYALIYYCPGSIKFISEYFLKRQGIEYHYIITGLWKKRKINLLRNLEWSLGCYLLILNKWNF